MMHEIYSIVKSIREDKKIKQADMAKLLKMAPNNYGKLERGEIQMTIDRLAQIGKIFNMHPSDIIDFNNRHIETEFQRTFENIRTELNNSKKVIARLVNSSMPMDKVNLLKSLIEKTHASAKLKSFNYDPLTGDLSVDFGNGVEVYH
jgi:transcriptional regulator with XRE-family HTH domain